MALFKNMSITSKGMILFARAQGGQPIHFTKMQVGSGKLNTEDPVGFSRLIDPKIDIPITSIVANTENKSATIVGNITNKNVTQALYICELGLWAIDPIEGEILYGYSNCDNFGDYYAPETQGAYSWQYQINAAVGNAANVTAEISELNWDYGVINSNTFVYLSGNNQKEINKVIDNSLKKIQEDIEKISTFNISLATEIAILKNASLNNLTNNIFFEDFKDLTSINLKNGCYDVVNKRLVI